MFSPNTIPNGNNENENTRTGWEDLIQSEHQEVESMATSPESTHETLESTFDHKGREYIDLDKIDVFAENGQMMFLEAYANNAINRATTKLENMYGDNVDIERVTWSGAGDVEQGIKSLAAEYKIAARQRGLVDTIREKLINEAALGSEKLEITDFLRDISESTNPRAELGYTLHEINVAPARELLRALEERMNQYRKVDTREYVESGLADGSLEVFEAAKFARISATQGEIGQEVVSWSEDENGNPIQEKVSTVVADKNTGEAGWIATKTDENGNPIIDRNGNLNQWIIDDTTFKKKI